jgi:Peptidase family M1 domain
MKRIFFLSLGVLLLCSLRAQTSQKAYFQQYVNYKINVTLDDTKHYLRGNIDITYRNESPDALSEIKMHLWPNAYRNKSTAFAEQALRRGKGRFYFADDKQLGGYKGLDFTVNGQKADFALDAKNIDIGTIKLKEPLQSGKSITISTPFELKIPASFSRLGHVGTSYQMTQWFPKPAVYDRNGWHAMPYLDMGEFYSEFGDFDVTITLPDNYVVGATGSLNTASEQKWIREQIAISETKLRDSLDEKKIDFPASSVTMKTINYSAKNVHDFAWFADKRFYVTTDTASLANGAKVPVFAYFTNEDGNFWKKGGASYVRRAVEFYSNEVGNYPWEHASAVQSALSAGGGMEYPMITVIGPAGSAKSLDEVITHEVGHNWFYGMLASNERDHAWMDEGMNTFYEQKYMGKYYGSDAPIDLPKFFQKRLHGKMMPMAIRFYQANNGETPPDTHSDHFSETQYGLQSYMKPALTLQWLEASMGETKYRAMIQEYFKLWSFKHPQPTDFEAIVQKFAPESNWVFEQMRTRKTSDYAIKSVKKDGDMLQIKLENKGGMVAPVPVSVISNGKADAPQWYPGFVGEKTITLASKEAEAVCLDALDQTYDLNKGNNYKKVGGMRMPTLGFLALAQNPERPTLGVLPVAHWNLYDQANLGLLLHRPFLPGKKLEFMLAPTFSTATGSMTGAGEVTYRYLPKAGKPQHIEFALQGRSFHNDYNQKFDKTLRFTKVSPSVTLHMPNQTNSRIHTIRARAVYINQDVLDFVDSATVNIAQEKWPIYELAYTLENKALPNPSVTRIALEQQSYKDAFDRDANYLKLTATKSTNFFFAPGKKIRVRAFAGYFIQNTERRTGSIHNSLARGSLSLLPQGFSDYTHDGMFMGRSENNGFLARQVENVDGGFKVGHGASQANNYGFSNNMAASINFLADSPKKLPLNLPLKMYFDAGYATNLSPIASDNTFKDNFIFSGGLNLSLLKGRVDLFFPLVSSSQIRRTYREIGSETSTRSKIKLDYLHQISWSINLKDLHPRTLRNGFSK